MIENPHRNSPMQMLAIVKLIVWGMFLLVGVLFVFDHVAISQIPSRNIRGNCGRVNCDRLMQELRSLYPGFVAEFVQECPSPKILAISTGVGSRDSNQAWFNCWEPQLEKGTRYGLYVGSLPSSNSEAEFLTPLPSSSPHTSELEKRYPATIRQIQFKCATKGGSLNILESKDRKSLELQCYFQGGVIPIDEDGDWKSDGEASMGASVDIIMGRFPMIIP